MSKDKSGKSLEKAVARIQQMLDPGSIVTHNEYIVDRIGNRRQFDVVIRGQAAGREYLGVVEAKDWSHKVGTPEVDAFITKARNVNANIILIVSNKGFSEPALRQAAHEGVGTLSLLPGDPIDAGFSIGVVGYAKEYQWGRYEFSMHCQAPGRSGALAITDINSVLLDGKPVYDWFAKQLSTAYSCATGPEPTRIEVRFKNATPCQIQGRTYGVIQMSMTAYRQCQIKRGHVRIRGDAFYDWQTEKLSWPIGGALQFNITEEMVAGWEIIDETPEIGPLTPVVEIFSNPIGPDQGVIDLEKYF